MRQNFMKRASTAGLVLLALVCVASTCEVGDTVGFKDGGLWSPDAFPLRVELTTPSGNGLTVDDTIMDGAVDAMNRQAGFRLFLRDDTSGAAPVTVHLSGGLTASAVDRLGEAETTRAAGVPVTCDVRLAPTYDVALSALALQHELGHCLQLAHDRVRVSIMYFEVRAPGEGFVQALTGSDVHRLRRAYWVRP